MFKISSMTAGLLKQFSCKIEKPSVDVSSVWIENESSAKKSGLCGQRLDISVLKFGWMGVSLFARWNSVLSVQLLESKGASCASCCVTVFLITWIKILRLICSVSI